MRRARVVAVSVAAFIVGGLLGTGAAAFASITITAGGRE